MLSYCFYYVLFINCNANFIKITIVISSFKKNLFCKRSKTFYYIFINRIVLFLLKKCKCYNNEKKANFVSFKIVS